MRFIYTKAFILFVSFVVVTLVITFLQSRGYGSVVSTVVMDAPKPVSFVAQGVTRPLKNFFSTIYNLKKISNTNTQLTQQVYNLQQQLVSYDEAKRENTILKQELGFVSSSKLTFISCSVVSQDPLGLTDTLVMDCGQNKGVSEGLGVISQGYLIGKVIYAGKNSSTVLLITSSEFSTDARLSKNGQSGVVKGSFGSGILIDQLSQNTDVGKGDMIVSGGINNKIPKDILIGQVSAITSSQNDLFKKAAILSPINFSNLQFLFVVEQ